MKMKSIKYWGTACLLLLGMTACIDDESTLATGILRAINITSPGTKDTIYVGYLDHLSITPSVSSGSESATDGLTYLWEIGDEPGEKPENFITLSEDTQLNAVINSEISSSPYMLRLTVTDTKNENLKYSKLWQVYVQSSFIDGIAVSSTLDDKTSDFSLIMNKDLTVNYDRDDKIYHNILRSATGAPCDRLLTQLTFSVYSGSFTSTSTENSIWAVTADGALYRYDTKDFSLDGTSLNGDNILTYTANIPKFTSTFIGHNLLFAISDKTIYSLTPASASTFGWQDETTSQYTIDNNVVITSPTSGNYNVFWLDSKTGHIIGLKYTMGTTIMYDNALAAKDGVFDPQDMGNYSAIAGGYTSDGKRPAFLMKNKTTGQYSICLLTFYQASIWNEDYTVELVPEQIPAAERRIDIPHAGKELLDKAVSVFFARNQAILYVVTANGVYGINFATNTPEVYTTAKFRPANGEKITKAKLFVQGAYACTTTNWPERDELAYNYNALVIATQSSTYEGKIIVIPMKQIGTGNLDTAKAKVYSGFGKILDFCATGY